MASPLEMENAQLRAQLLEIGLCMQQFGHALLTSHRELTESCAALCRSDEAAEQQQEPAHANRVSQRQAALYLAFLGRAAGLALEQATAAEAIRSQASRAGSGLEEQPSTACAQALASTSGERRSAAVGAHRGSSALRPRWPWQRQRRSVRTTGRVAPNLGGEYAARLSKSNDGASCVTHHPPPEPRATTGAPKLNFTAATPSPAAPSGSAEVALTPGNPGRRTTPGLFVFK